MAQLPPPRYASEYNTSLAHLIGPEFWLVLQEFGSDRDWLHLSVSEWTSTLSSELLQQTPSRREDAK